MRNITTTAVCLAIVSLSTSCKQKPQTDDYAIEKVTHPLSNDEVVSAFNALGLTIVRFDCMLPQRTGIHISSEQFVDGKSSGAESEGTLYVDKGLQKLLLFKKEREDKTVEFSLKSNGATTSCGTASLDGYHATTHGSIGIDTLTPDKKPIYVYAANRSSIEGLSSESVDVEVLAEKYAFLMVLYVSIDDK
jgi:hypothetical protein